MCISIYTQTCPTSAPHFSLRSCRDAVILEVTFSFFGHQAGCVPGTAVTLDLCLCHTLQFAVMQGCGHTRGHFLFLQSSGWRCAKHCGHSGPKLLNSAQFKQAKLAMSSQAELRWPYNVCCSS